MPASQHPGWRLFVSAKIPRSESREVPLVSKIYRKTRKKQEKSCHLERTTKLYRFMASRRLSTYHVTVIFLGRRLTENSEEKCKRPFMWAREKL